MAEDRTKKQYEEVAIVGMAGRFPGAASIEEFWHNLCNGVESVTPFSPDELQSSGIDDDTLKNPLFVNAGALMDDADGFDASFFGISNREAEIMDPQHRVFLECAHEVIESAGYDPERFDGIISIFGGVAPNTYFQNNLMTRPDLLQIVGHYPVMIGSEREYAVSRVSFKLNLKGPGISVNTACSSSAVAIHLACQSLLSGESDMALAGGARIKVPLKAGYIYQEGGILSPDGHCRAFDAQARGTVIGNGVAMIVMKRLSEAISDGDTVHAIIKGSAINNDGSQKIGFTAPSIQAQTILVSDALAIAGVHPDDISYIECHGTGTSLGDPIEVTALTQAFSEKTNRKNFCGIGSVKTNIGHLDAGAGVAGIIKTVLALKNKQLPPSLNFEEPNPQIDFDNSPFYVNTELSKWPAGTAPRRAGVSSFGLGGTNAHIILEEAPDTEPSGTSRPWQLLLLSARTHTALDKATENLAIYLNKHPHINLGDVAYTLQVGRKTFNHRRIAVIRDYHDAVTILETLDAQRVLTSVQEPVESDVVFMFSGQGAQYVNMGLDLYSTELIFREQINLCSDILKPLLSMDIRHILYPEEGSEAAAEKLKQTAVTQPVLFAIEYALAKLWMSWGVHPRAMVGHSIGEYVAACISGVFSLEDGLSLVTARGKLMQELPGGSMLAVFLSEEELQPFLGEKLFLAAINATSICTVSGTDSDIENLAELLATKNVEYRPLHTSHAFHSDMMDPIMDPFVERLKLINLNPPRIPFVSNTSGSWISSDEATDPAYWARHMRQTVRFADCVEVLLKEPNRVLLEVGPGQTLSMLARKQSDKSRNQTVLSSTRHPKENKTDDAFILNTIGQLWLNGVHIDWPGFYQNEKRQRVTLPTYPFDRKRFWIEQAGQTNVININEPENDDNKQQKLNDLPKLRPEHLLKSRKEKLLLLLKQLLEEVAGLDIRSVEESVTFLEMGLDSLFLTQWTFILKKKFNIQIAFERLFEDLSTLNSLAEFIDKELPSEALSENHLIQEGTSFEHKTVNGKLDELTVQESHLLDKVLQSERSIKKEQESALVKEIQPIERRENIPLSFSQQRLWFIEQLAPNTPVYNLPDAYRLRGRLDAGILKRSLNEIVRRHEVLRTTFKMHSDKPVQHISSSMVIEMPFIDLSNRASFDREIELARILEIEAAKPFNLVDGPLLRTMLIRLQEKEHVLFFMPHHIIFDGWSFGLMHKELISIYESLRTGNPYSLPELNVQYSDFAVWQQNWLQGEELERHLTYWRKNLSGELPVLEIPTDYPRPVMQSLRGAREAIEFPATLVESLPLFGRQEQATLFMVLLAAFKVILYRYADQEDICIGSPIANRINPETEDLIGFFVNTLVFRTNLQGNPSFREVLRRVREVCLAAYRHQTMPFELLVEELNPKRDLSRTPLFQAMFTFLTGSIDFDTRMGDVEWHRENIVTKVAQTDLSFWISKTDNGIRAELEYCTDLFNRTTIVQFLKRFQVLLEGIVENPDASISILPLMTDSDRKQFTKWNDTNFEYPRTVCLHELFEEQVEKTPDDVAVIFEENQLTYRQLNYRANQLAHNLKLHNVGPESLVGIYMERSIDMVVGLLGILKAGGAYLPLDPLYPKERITYMLDDAQVSVILSQQSLKGELLDQRADVVLMDTDWDAISRLSEENLSSNVQAHNLAYLIYTSGSTGKPKGVEILHRAVVNFLLSMRKEPGLTEEDILLSVTTLSFDIHVLEIFLPLITGARLVLVSREVASDGNLLIKSIMDNGVTTMQATPSTWHLLLEAGWRGHTELKMLCGGEALPRELANKLLERSDSLWNMYGPTETTVWSAVNKVELSDRPVLVGPPILNTQFYILDRNLQSVPTGVPGELHIGGDGLSRGYRNRLDLTNERFIDNPFSNEPETRLYKTGDLARYLPDGNIEFLGRLDHQVKIRSFRIELGEIEYILGQFPEVKQAVVMTREDSLGEAQLIAYVIPKGEQDLSTGSLSSYLEEKLPYYMVPSVFIMIDRFPLTPNGKIDRKSLPLPDRTNIKLEATFISPRNPVEQQLTDMWEKVLGVNPIGIRDSFFELGGHSLLAATLFAKIERTFGKKIPLATLFRAPTIEQIASVLQQEELSDSWSSLVEIKKGNSLPPFFCIHSEGGNVLEYHELAHQMEPDQPFYALQAQGLDGKRTESLTIEDMVSQYIKEIKTVQKRGPYYIGGYCLGGLLAFEMAHQLQNQGDEIALLAIINTLTPANWKNILPNMTNYQITLCRIYENIEFEIGNINVLKSKAKLYFVRERMKKFLTVLQVNAEKLFQRILPEHRLNTNWHSLGYNFQRVVDAHKKAYRQYSPKPYRGHLTLFKAGQQPKYINPDPSLGWEKLVKGNTYCHEIAGHHKNLLKEPNVVLLAQKLNACIIKARTKYSNSR